MKELGGIGCAVIVLVGIVIAATAGWWLFRVQFAEEIGRGNAEIQVQSASNRLVQYDRFFNECASIQTLEVSIDQETLHLTQETDPTVRAQIRQNLSGLNATRARAAANYNASSTAEYTRGQFQDAELPYTINIEYEAGGTKTTCGS